MATKDKDKKGPSTQPTGTQGVNAVGVNHGTNKGYVAYSTYSPDAAPVPGKKFNVVGVPGATVPPAPWDMQPVQQVGPQQVQQQTAPVAAPVQQATANNNGQTAEGNKPAKQNTRWNPGGERISLDEWARRHDVKKKPTATQQPTETAVVQPTTQPTTTTVQAAPQQIVLPEQFGGKTITLETPQQPQAKTVTIGNQTYELPKEQTTASPSQQQTTEPTAAQRNEEYERTKAYNQAVDNALAAGVSPNAIREHGDVLSQNEPEELKQSREKALADEKNRAAQNPEGNDIQKTLLERLNELNETPEDRANREKREARQRKWAAISEGLANVFNVGGAIAGARPAQWKSGVADLYANQEAESDRRRSEYKEALKDLMSYNTAIRNGDIATARAIEEKRKNDFYEYRITQELEAKAAEAKLKADAQAKEQARKDQEAKNKQRKYDDDHRKAEKQLNGTYKPSGNTTKSSSRGRGRSGGSRATGAAAAKSAKAAAKRRAKAATQGTKFGKK